MQESSLRALVTAEGLRTLTRPSGWRLAWDLANDRLGTWLFGAPVGIPLAIFRHRHFAHHRTFSTDDDPKTVYRRSVRGGLSRDCAHGRLAGTGHFGEQPSRSIRC